MTNTTIDYYMSPNSPWTYLGHARFCALAREHAVTVNVQPVDFATIFAQTGGLPVTKRAPARQAYRLLELERWRTHLNVELNLAPRYWPADDWLAAAWLMAARDDGQDVLALAGAFMRAVWAEDRNIADVATLLDLANASGCDGETLRIRTEELDWREKRITESERALSRGVFGAPTYLHDGELFWGQDRLDFLANALAGSR